MRSLALSFAMTLLLLGCDDPREPAAACGDGNITGSEACDGANLGGNSCTSIPGAFTGGSLACADDCLTFDSTGCGTLTCDVTNVGCTAADPTACACVGCVDDGTCNPSDDCVCPDCASDAACGCNDDGICDPFDEACACADCALHPECP